MGAGVSALTLLLVSVCLAGTFWGHGWCLEPMWVICGAEHWPCSEI